MCGSGVQIYTHPIPMDQRTIRMGHFRILASVGDVVYAAARGSLICQPISGVRTDIGRNLITLLIRLVSGWHRKRLPCLKNEWLNLIALCVFANHACQ
jgi:hypothetical protein